MTGERGGEVWRGAMSESVQRGRASGVSAEGGDTVGRLATSRRFSSVNGLQGIGRPVVATLEFRLRWLR